MMMQRPVVNTMFRTVNERVHPDLFTVRNTRKENFPPWESGGKKVFPARERRAQVHKQYILIGSVNHSWMLIG